MISRINMQVRLRIVKQRRSCERMVRQAGADERRNDLGTVFEGGTLRSKTLQTTLGIRATTERTRMCEGPPLEGTSLGKRLNSWIISAFVAAELRAKMTSAKVSAAFGAGSEVATRSGPCGPAWLCHCTACVHSANE